MTYEEHLERHTELYKALDELVADWIAQTDGRPSKATVLDLIRWSYSQTKSPTVEGPQYAHELGKELQ